MPAVAPHTPRRVLLVDDDRLIRTLYADMLSRHGVASLDAADADAALARLADADVQAVLCDIHMPGRSGLDFLREVRRARPDLPVVLVTATPGLETAMEAVALGAYRYLTKPVAEPALLEVVEEALRAGASALGRTAAAPPAADAETAALSADLDRAVAGLHVVFQPIVSYSTRRVFGFEALARTRAEVLSRPDHLFAAAERLGRVHQLGRILRAQTAEAARAAPAGPHLFVNIHPHDLLDDDLYDAAAPLSALARRVVLEVTERSSLEAVDDLPRRTAALRRLGFRLAIDDLGAGFAGLGCFSALSPDVVKIDMSLVRGLEADPRRQRVVSALAGLADDLGALCVAEGVETPAERDALLDLGYDHLQGFLFARPATGFQPPAF